MAFALVYTGAQQYDFEPSCASAEDYGWPRFNSAADLVANAPWASYFGMVYGTLPTTFPVCVFDFGVLNKTAYIEAGLSGTRSLVTNTSVLTEGDLFDGAFGYQIFHSSWVPAPNNTWVEVAHSVLPTELEGMWAWRTRGSGIWYNIGRTKVFPTPSDPALIHHDAIEFLSANCSKRSTPFWPLQESVIFGFCAREKGFDSIQFAPQDGEVPTGTFGLPALTEIVLVNLDGDKNCGVGDPSNTSLRMGWLAEKQCACANLPIPPTCGVMGFPPAGFPSVLLHPPLCAAQAEDQAVPCIITACTSTTCSIS